MTEEDLEKIRAEIKILVNTDEFKKYIVILNHIKGLALRHDVAYNDIESKTVFMLYPKVSMESGDICKYTDRALTIGTIKLNIENYEDFMIKLNYLRDLLLSEN